MNIQTLWPCLYFGPLNLYNYPKQNIKHPKTCKRYVIKYVTINPDKINKLLTTGTTL